jgi:hypothetical protein
MEKKKEENKKKLDSKNGDLPNFDKKDVGEEQKKEGNTKQEEGQKEGAKGSKEVRR